MHKREDRMSNRTRQHNKGTERKMESNDSSEIPDRGETSEEPSLPSGLLTEKRLTGTRPLDKRLR